jgi:hypothetical protein
MKNNDPDPVLYQHSVPAGLGSCDAFVSHSWSDDADAKWVALQEWCASFRRLHGREPSLWIDKFCINQAEIDTDLQCLPVFLCGCRELLVLCGTTYFGRLWCVMELFTHHYTNYTGLGKERFRRGFTMIPVLRDGHHEEDLRCIASAVRSFDVERSACSSRQDRIRMVDIIQAACGSLAVFNTIVQSIVPDVAQNGPGCI